MVFFMNEDLRKTLLALIPVYLVGIAGVYLTLTGNIILGLSAIGLTIYLLLIATSVYKGWIDMDPPNDYLNEKPGRVH